MMPTVQHFLWIKNMKHVPVVELCKAAQFNIFLMTMDQMTVCIMKGVTHKEL